jgi:hypothetical protein
LNLTPLFLLPRKRNIDHNRLSHKTNSTKNTTEVQASSCLHFPLSTTIAANHHAHILDLEHYEHAYSSKTQTKQLLAPKAKRTVAFAPTVTGNTTLHVNDYSNDEIQSCWFNDVEYKAIKKDIRFAAKLLTDNNGLLGKDDEHDCQRGLEMHTRKGAHRRLQNKLVARQAVLDEQNLQWEEGVYDPEYLAMVYQVVSSSCQATARDIALKDQLDVTL